jgi:hypothetical protein
MRQPVKGVELLFLFAFAFGRHSAAALTHLSFLVTLAFAMLCYARRWISSRRRLRALLVFVSRWQAWMVPVAYNDVTGVLYLHGFIWPGSGPRMTRTTDC